MRATKSQYSCPFDWWEPKLFKQKRVQFSHLLSSTAAPPPPIPQIRQKESLSPKLILGGWRNWRARGDIMGGGGNLSLSNLSTSHPHKNVRHWPKYKIISSEINKLSGIIRKKGPLWYFRCSFLVTEIYIYIYTYKKCASSSLSAATWLKLQAHTHAIQLTNSY